MISRTTVLSGCLVICACAPTVQQTATQDNQLISAGFRALPADTPERMAALRKLPANKVVKTKPGGFASYIYADPLVCGCLYAGDQAAYGRYVQVLRQRRLGDERTYADTDQFDNEPFEMQVW